MTRLFSESAMGSLRLPNRLVRSATMENLAEADGLPGAAALPLFERLARGGAGLVVAGFAAVNPDGLCLPRQARMDRDDAVPAWRRITDRVHELGGRIAMQLGHGGRQIPPPTLGRRRPLAPSAFPVGAAFRPSRRMTEEDIRRTIEDFGAAAARVRAAGFDAVQVHAAHGYLVSGFLSPLTNRRRDDWGGDPDRRLRFALEVCRGTRAAVGAGFPVLVKMNLHDCLPFGLTPRESVPAALRLAAEGVDAIEVSGGIMESALSISRGGSPAAILGRGRPLGLRLFLRLALAWQELRHPFREAYFLPLARQLKPKLPIPLVLVGGIRSPETAEKVVDGDAADFVAMARPLVREPDLPRRWRDGLRRTATCTSCNRCLGEIALNNPLRCYLRPEADATGKRPGTVDS